MKPYHKIRSYLRKEDIGGAIPSYEVLMMEFMGVDYFHYSWGAFRGMPTRSCFSLTNDEVFIYGR